MSSQRDDHPTEESTLDARKRAPAALRRAAAATAAGAVVATSGFLGGGVAAAADPVVIGTCTEDVTSAEHGQPIVVSPRALDSRVKDAAGLTFPLDFDRIDRIHQQFLRTAPIRIGEVTAEEQHFSGSALADALANRIAGLAAVEDRGDTMNFHVGNLAVTCLGGVNVPGQPKPEPSEPSPTPDEPTTGQPTESPDPGSSGDEKRNPGTPGSGSGGDPTTDPIDDQPQRQAGGPGSNYSPGSAEQVAPSEYAYVPGSLPPWSDSRFGETSGGEPATGDLRTGDEHNQQDRVREAGSAQALPTGSGERVALPVLLAAVSLAGVTAALIRTWVLRRV
ncbi:hypothetical protein SAMN04487820_102382 [Actinopolyspora mzabensis]|uniref:Uncharacterized protein n=1 Tax=Actinopolyspora mzabensis TaxID=995066 RepID=A0A1G8X562_ACTMZ|nr:hypothetical protein [Actinopolyspora mzabensis]SDJ85507.1 hypothetical protein SAMN04487820_102382 [Actinopolyspora mzabensis]